MPFEKAREICAQFNGASEFVTPENVLKWLRDAGKTDILETLDDEPGGNLWFQCQIYSIRRELFGK